MKRASHLAAEFEGQVTPDGSVAIPRTILEHLGLSDYARVSVRLTRRNTAALLKRMEVTEEELERIASFQLESADQIVRFLLAEGALKSRRRQLRLT